MAVGYICSSCRQSFDAESVYDQGGGTTICKGCFARPAGRPTRSTAVPPQIIHRFSCSNCGGTFSAESIYDQGGIYICHSCYARQSGESDLASAVAETSARRRPTHKQHKNILVPVLLIICILAVVGVGWHLSQLRQEVAASGVSDAKQGQKQNGNVDVSNGRRKGSISGEAWIQKTSGETLVLASERVYLLPVTLRIDGPTGHFHFGIERINEPIHVAAQLPGNQMAEATAKDATYILTKLNPYVETDTVPTIVAVNASIDTVQLWAAELGTKKALYGDSSEMAQIGTKSIEGYIPDEDFWKFVSASAILSVTTGREGKFSMKDVPAGKYVIGCRAFNTALRGVVFWGITVDVSEGGEATVDLTPSTGSVVSY